jgi:hypothetical protein
MTAVFHARVRLSVELILSCIWFVLIVWLLARATASAGCSAAWR